MLPRVSGLRYVVPLREGGSLPAVVDTERGPFVVKFLGAGQGPKALVAELIAGQLALAVGLPVPEQALVLLADGFGKGEPDPEIQDLLRASIGTNFGLAYLAGALSFDPAVEREIDPDLAADIVWFDSFITNIDRTPRNPNMLVCRGRLWLIDHGAALYVHHGWQGWEGRIQTPFPQIKDHVLLHLASDLAAADARVRPLLDELRIRAIIDAVPDEWLAVDPSFDSLAAHRGRYAEYLLARLHGPRAWLQEAIDAQRRGPERYAPRLTHRVV